MRPPATRHLARLAAACAVLAIFANLACAHAEQRQQSFPLLADIPPRPAAFSAPVDSMSTTRQTDVTENERRYRQWVAELQAKRQEIIDRLQQSQKPRQ